MEDIYSDISLVIDCFYNMLENDIDKDAISISNVNLDFLEDFDEIFMNMLQCQSELRDGNEAPNRYLFELENVWLVIDIKSDMSDSGSMTQFSLSIFKDSIDDALECLYS